MKRPFRPSLRRLLLMGAVGLLVVLALADCASYTPVTRKESTEAALQWPERVNWDTARDEVAQVLSGYIQARTINPPGDETVGAQYLARLLEREGIASEIFEFTPGRGSLVARLKATQPGGEGALCLTHHIDVVPAEGDKWTHAEDTFSGRMDQEGWLWGRGALDMKSLGAIQVMTLVLLKRLNVPLNRDIVLLAVADEEVDSRGMQFMVNEHWDKLGCAHALNEGGLGLVDPMFKGQTVYTASVGEKGALWLDITAEGVQGHGSYEQPGEALGVIHRIISKLREHEPETEVSEPMYQLFHKVGSHHGGFSGWVMRRRWLVDWLVVDELMEDPGTGASVINTIHVTGIRTPDTKPNVVPSSATVTLDCRLLPGFTPEDMLAQIKAILGERMSRNLKFDVRFAQAATVSPTDDPFFKALERHALAGHPDAAFGPVVMPGSTDSTYLRNKGVRTYGFLPVQVGKKDLKGMHGPDERVSVKELGDGLRIIFSAVVEVAAAAPAGGGQAPVAEGPR